MRKGPGCLTGPFTKKDERLGPYGKPLTERVRSLREGPVLTGGSLTGWPFTKKDEEAYGKAWALTGNPLRGGTVLTKRAPYGEGRGALRVPFTEKDDEEASYGKPLTERDDPYGKGRSLRESPLRGWLPLQKRTAYGKLRGEILPELGGNFRLCAVDQKKPFFLEAGPCLAFLCPLRRLTGRLGPYGKPLTGRDGPYGKGPPYGEGRSLQEGPPYGESLTGMAPFTKKDGLWEATGRDFTRIRREFPLVRRRPKKAVFS